MGRFQLESIYLYFPPSSQLVYVQIDSKILLQTLGMGSLYQKKNMNLMSQNLLFFHYSSSDVCQCVFDIVSLLGNVQHKLKIRGWSEKFPTLPTTDEKLRTRSCWVGTRTGAGVTSTVV